MASHSDSAYSELIQKAREIKMLESYSAMLSWDEQTYMPPGASKHFMDLFSMSWLRVSRRLRRKRSR
jgi:Zn-dependent M32 family carboxypeptidase